MKYIICIGEIRGYYSLPGVNIAWEEHYSLLD